jgi:hypothetical protein
MTGTNTTVVAARQALTEHRFYPYRGCAPDPDQPTRMAGNPDLPLGAHHAPDVDGGEDQQTRRAREEAAIEVCLSCPVMVQCDRYANSITSDGKLAEPDGIQGGRRALERHRLFIQTRHEVAAAAPDARFHTRQKQAILRALAAFTDPYDVASWAGMDVRTANWQRSVLVTLLNLNKATATRRELLDAAVQRGLLDASAVVPDDGTVPAVPASMPSPPRPDVPPAPMPSPPQPDVQPVPAPMPGPGQDKACLYEPVHVPAPRRTRFTAVPGQLSLDDALPGLAPVTTLHPHTARLEAAA